MAASPAVATSAFSRNEKSSALVSAQVLPPEMQAEIEYMAQHIQALYHLMDKVMQPKVDFDRIPGTDKPTLLQPGAQLLCKLFKLAPSFEVLAKTVDLERTPPYVDFEVECKLHNQETGVYVGSGVGAANSMENRYRWRREGDDKVQNDDIMTLQNTLFKMAKKRAFVDATLNVTGASRLFTQDLEDLGLTQVEPASSKQVNFLRSLGKQKSLDDAALLEMARGKTDRQMDKLEDLTRPEASALIEELRGGAQQGGGEAAAQGPAQPAAGQSSGKHSRGDEHPTWDEFWRGVRELKLDGPTAAQKLGRENFRGLSALERQQVLDSLRSLMSNGGQA